MTATASAAIRSSFLHSGRGARMPGNRGKRSISAHFGLADMNGLGIKDCVLIDELGYDVELVYKKKP